MALKANSQISEEEAKKMKDGSLIVIEGQKLKQSYEFEVGLSSSENIWLPRDDLQVIKRGFEKVCLHLYNLWSLILIVIFFCDNQKLLEIDTLSREALFIFSLSCYTSVK
jgi:hypothetical protein